MFNTLEKNILEEIYASKSPIHNIIVWLLNLSPTKHLCVLVPALFWQLIYNGAENVFS